MDPAVIAALIGGAGLGPVVVTTVKAITAYLTGNADREKNRLQELATERDMWKARADRSADWRRTLQEYVAQLRLLLIGQGVRPDDIPPTPSEPAPIYDPKGDQ